MIGRLRGELVQKRPPALLLDVNGVGYELEAPMSTFYVLPEQGAQIVLYTHLQVREDAHSLFGFASETEKAMFRALLKVNGVGARMALAILSGMSAEEFAQCVQAEDVTSLTRIPGVGKKTAQRLIVEMRDRLEQMGVRADAAPVAAVAGDPASSGGDAVADAVSALIALGYKAPEASRMVRAVESEGLASEELIRAALQSTTKKVKSR
ncbi:MAG TPA: Holliday junction branch migration protein RuvA [Kiloniellaceae bacterium]|nr:Holliday junction branch migration protein RuvA [Kiloniellaceae bacterium]